MSDDSKWFSQIVNTRDVKQHGACLDWRHLPANMKYLLMGTMGFNWKTVNFELIIARKMQSSRTVIRTGRERLVNVSA